MGPKSGRQQGVASGQRRRGYASLVAVLVMTTSLMMHPAAHAAFDGTIDTYVGGGNGDGSDAITATIDPRGLTFVADPTGADAYIADGFNHRVRRVDGATGIITTVAGNGTKGFSGDGGPAQNASLALPMDVAVDAAGNLYIADRDNNRIRKVTPNGIISTFAGNGNLSYGGDGGLATQAALYNPQGVRVGPDGYVYIADMGNCRIRRVGPPNCGPSTCIISTVVGSGEFGYSGDGGPALSAALKNPTGLGFDSAGNMYVADAGNQVVRRVVNGRIEAFAGGGTVGLIGGIGDNGPAIGSVLRFPQTVAVDNIGAVYITDTQQRRLRKVVNGIITTVAGTGIAGSGGDGGPAALADMYFPYGVAIHPSGGLWISTTSDLAAPTRLSRVRKVDSALIIDAAVGGGLGDGAPAGDVLVDPRGSDTAAGAGPLPDLYFADGINNVIRYVDGSDGTIHVLAGNGTAGYSGDGGLAINARLKTPLDVAVDAQKGYVYIADTSNNAVRRVDANGIVTTVAGTGLRGFSGDGGPAAQAQVAGPTGIAVDANGALYIADFNNNRVRKVVNGIISTVAGSGQSGYNGDGGSATAASLRNPWDVAVASDGTMYIADAFNYRIRRVTPSGVISTYAGTGLSGFTGDGGLATQARLFTPSMLALDGANNLFINDNGNNRIRVVAYPSGVIDTVAGNGQSGDSGDGGPARAASFSSPTGVSIDPTGAHLFVSAKDDLRVRIVSFNGVVVPTLTPTATSIPPTATSIPPTATFTSVPPTATFTSIPSSPTRTPTLASTPTRTGTSTRTNTAAPSNGSVSGHVTYYSNGSPVSNVRVDLSGSQTMSATTNSTGSYVASNVALGGWSVDPMRTGGMGNSVSSLDAARVLQVIAGFISFTPMQRLACDVTGDGNLSALDAVRILQYSAGVINDLPLAAMCGSDWIFYPSPDPFQFQQITTPLMGSGTCRPGDIFLTLTSALNTAPNQDFEGIVIGDCTGNWTPSAGALRQVAASAGATVHAGALRAGRSHTYQLPIYVRSAAPFSALDVKLTYNPAALRLRAVHPHGAASDALIGVHNDDGTLTVTLASATEIDPSRGPVLVAEFSANADGSTPMIQLVRGHVDEQAARLVTHSRH